MPNDTWFGFFLQKLTGNLIICGCHACVTLPFVARLGIVRLNYRFDQDNVSFVDNLLHMLSFGEIQAVLLQIGFEFISERHLGWSNKCDWAVKLGERVTKGVHGAHAHITYRQPIQSVYLTFLPLNG